MKNNINFRDGHVNNPHKHKGKVEQTSTKKSSYNIEIIADIKTFTTPTTQATIILDQIELQ